MRRGLLIVFSGLDGAGKSTQIELLIDHLRTEGRDPIYWWTRGGYTPLFSALKSLLRHLSRHRLVPPPGDTPQRTRTLARPGLRRLWLVVALLDLLLVYGLQVRWWLWHGKYVVCDRYLWDTQVDFRLNFAADNVEQWILWRLLARISPRPGAAFLLLIPVEEAIIRIEQKAVPYQESASVLAQRLAQYQALAQNGHWLVLDGRRSIADLAGEIQDQVQTLNCTGQLKPA